MKKRVIFICFIASILLLQGCASNLESSQNKDNAGNSESEENVLKIEFSDDYRSLEDGFSYVENKENYAFEDFLAQGGASSDSDVFEFLAGNLFADARNLSMAETAFGCSAFSVQNEEDEWIFGRNFDWSKCNALVIKSTPEEGYASIATVNTDFIKQGAGLASAFLSNEQMSLAALYAPLDGMNEEGFCISVNMISDGEVIEQNTDKPDLTTTTAVRMLLNKAASVEKAVDLLESYDLHSSMGMMIHFAMSDTTGNSVVVEYIDNEMHVIQTRVVTNFYLSEGEKYGIGTEQSHERYDILVDLVSNKKLSMTDIANALDRVSKDNFEDSSTTEWSIVFNQNTKETVYYHREDYTKGYQFSLN